MISATLSSIHWKSTRAGSAFKHEIVAKGGKDLYMASLDRLLACTLSWRTGYMFLVSRSRSMPDEGLLTKGLLECVAAQGSLLSPAFVLKFTAPFEAKLPTKRWKKHAHFATCEYKQLKSLKS